MSESDLQALRQIIRDEIRIATRQVVDVDELTQIIPLCKSGLERLARAGKIPCHTVGRRRMFVVADVIKAISAGNIS